MGSDSFVEASAMIFEASGGVSMSQPVDLLVEIRELGVSLRQ